MREKVLFNLKNLYRENMQVKGFTFGSGEKSVCIVGSTRGNEIQQTYICSLLIEFLKEAEAKGLINKGKSIMVVPTLNTYSINIGKRFWPIDNTDINRMFPGYSLGETTQRIAGGVFEKIQGYKYGIQFTSFYIPGNFLQHVKIMKTEYTDSKIAKLFSLPYVVVRNPRPYDTTTLNYNWQIWNTNAFSIYSSCTDSIDENDAEYIRDSVITFLIRTGIIQGTELTHGTSVVINDGSFVGVHANKGGYFLNRCKNNVFVREGELLAVIKNAFTSEIVEEVYAPITGNLYYTCKSQAVQQGTLLFQIIPNSL